MRYSVPATLLSALSLSQLAVAQDPVPLPQITGDSGSNAENCGGCYVVADVAGVVFGTETLPATVTNSVVVVSGMNGTTFTTTSLVFDESQFTLTSPGGIVPGPLATGTSGRTTFNTQGTLLTINGITLTSPTAYNVFTAFSTTRTVFTNGQCTVLLGTPTQLLTAFSVPIPTGVTDFASFQSVAEQSFILAMGIPSCSQGGENFSPTMVVPLNVTTSTVTTTSTRSFNPMPVSVAFTSTAAPAPTTFVGFGPFTNVSVALSTPTSGQSEIVLPPATQGGPTIVEAAAARNQNTIGTLLSGAIAMIMGLVA